MSLILRTRFSREAFETARQIRLACTSGADLVKMKAGAVMRKPFIFTRRRLVSVSPVVVHSLLEGEGGGRKKTCEPCRIKYPARKLFSFFFVVVVFFA